ncbi:MAG TPA: iron ABC transporter permease [Stellaceae bacterium]|nr:iron ABC transporter permease [Stellaceae bacterium]
MSRASWWLGLPSLALFLLFLAAFAVGQFPVAPHDLGAVLWAKLTGTASGVPPTVETVIWQIRLPRIAAAVLIGAALAAAGATYQGLFRNPLVSPDILGVAAGAGLGAALAIFMGLSVAIIQVLAFAGGLGAVLVVYLIGTAMRGRDPILVLVLAGVAMGTLLGSAISLVKVFADPYNQLPAITFWLLGSLTSIAMPDLRAVLPAILIGLVPLYLLRWRMNLMSLGDEEARALGTETRVLRAVFIAAATLITSAAVSVSGIIGWIGLIIPHVARLLAGPEFSRLLPAAMLLGAGYLLAVDTLARTMAAIEVPIGILTAFIGAPFFLWLLAASRRGWQ